MQVRYMKDKPFIEKRHELVCPRTGAGTNTCSLMRLEQVAAKVNCTWNN